MARSAATRIQQDFDLQELATRLLTRPHELHMLTGERVIEHARRLILQPVGRVVQFNRDHTGRGTLDLGNEVAAIREGERSVDMPIGPGRPGGLEKGEDVDYQLATRKVGRHDE